MAPLLQRLLATSATTGYVETDRDGTVVATNPAFADRLGIPADQVTGHPIERFLMTSDSPRVRGWVDGGAVPEEPVTVNFAVPDGAPFSLRCLIERDESGVRILGEPDAVGDRTATDRLMGLNNELATMARERARRERELERTREELEAALNELRTSYGHLQTVQEVLPLCMGCGRVQADEERLETVVHYLKANEILLGHGYCPACAGAVGREQSVEESEA